MSKPEPRIGWQNPARAAEAATGRADVIKQAYLDELTDCLKNNCRPAITNLSLLANEYSYMYGDIVDCIEKRLKACPMPAKLAHLYLVDCIIKNHGDPYVVGFSKHLPYLFAEAYESVDAESRQKMRRLLGTWEHPQPAQPGQLPPRLFSSDILQKTKQKIDEVDAKGTTGAAVIVNPNRVPPPGASEVHVNPRVVAASQPQQAAVGGPGLQAPSNGRAPDLPPARSSEAPRSAQHSSASSSSSRSRGPPPPGASSGPRSGHSRRGPSSPAHPRSRGAGSSASDGAALAQHRALAMAQLSGFMGPGALSAGPLGAAGPAGPLGPGLMAGLTPVQAAAAQMQMQQQQAVLQAQQLQLLQAQQIALVEAQAQAQAQLQAQAQALVMAAVAPTPPLPVAPPPPAAPPPLPPPDGVPGEALGVLKTLVDSLSAQQLQQLSDLLPSLQSAGAGASLPAALSALAGPLLSGHFDPSNAMPLLMELLTQPAPAPGHGPGHGPGPGPAPAPLSLPVPSPGMPPMGPGAPAGGGPGLGPNVNASDLFSSLAQLGLMAPPPPAAPAPAAPAPAPDASRPSYTPPPPTSSLSWCATPSFLSPPEEIVASLYRDIPKQCSQCGFRMYTDAQMTEHMDWHFAMRTREHQRKDEKRFSRQYFLPASEWVEWREARRGDKQVASVFFEGGEGDKGGEGAGEAPQEPEPSVPADESQEACAICGERFETVWDEANEVWMYPSALYLSVDRTGPLDPTAAPNAPRGPIVHRKCVPSGPMPAAPARPPSALPFPLDEPYTPGPPAEDEDRKSPLPKQESKAEEDAYPPDVKAEIKSEIKSEVKGEGSDAEGDGGRKSKRRRARY
eukprot:tig00000396_g24896.t1